MLCAPAAETTSTTTLRVRNLAEEDSYPDLGVYLQPDPLHRESASMSSGPQAYAYAAGRPLVYSDPLGLKIRCSTPALTAELEALKRDALVGKMVRDLDEGCSDSWIVEKDYNDPLMIEHNGGVTSSNRTGFGEYSFTTSVNLRRAQEYVRPWGLETSWRYLLGHELAHAYLDWRNGSRPAKEGSDAYAVGIENWMRAPGPQRPRHDR